MSKLKIIIIGCWLLLCSTFAMAQAPVVRVEAVFDSTHILTGDHLKLHLTARTSQGHSLSFTSSDSWQLKNCEVLRAETPKQSDKTKETILKQDFIVTAFDTGAAVIAPIAVLLDNLDTAALTDTLRFCVDTLPGGVDTTQAFRDIKLPLGGMEKAPKAKSKALLIIIIALIVLALAVLAYCFFKFWLPKIKAKCAAKIREQRRVSSGVVALTHIKELKAKELCEKGRAKEHYSELSQILRTYLDDQWDVNAMEMVTDEIMQALKTLDVSEQQRLELLKFFQLSDLVKYARKEPAIEENAQHMDNVTKFVRETDQQEQVRRAQQTKISE